MSSHMDRFPSLAMLIFGFPFFVFATPQPQPGSLHNRKAGFFLSVHLPLTTRNVTCLIPPELIDSHAPFLSVEKSLPGSLFSPPNRVIP